MKCLVGVDRAGAHVDDSVDLSKRALSQRLFVDVNGALSGSAGLTGRHLGRVAATLEERDRCILKIR